MAVSIKSAREIELMREAGKRLAHVHQELEAMIAPGISTWEIDAKGEKLIRDCGCIPNFLHYNGYPASICVSVNDEVVHGIPRKDRYLKEGDIVSLDAGLIYKGYHSDAARTHAVGKVSTEAQKLMDVTKQSFFEGIKMAKEGQHLHDISRAIEEYVTPYGYGIVRDLVGHGIGTALHEDPQIPNYAQKRRGVRLQAGMTLAIEPMINAGTWQVRFLRDGWTVVTKGWLLVSALRKHDSGDRWGTGDPDVVLRRTQMVGKLAVSLAGHDKGSIFLVIREDGDVIWLADGISRLYQSPKRKKRKHVQLVLNGGMDSSELEDLFQNPADADTKIKRCIKLYSMEKANERR